MPETTTVNVSTRSDSVRFTINASHDKTIEEARIYAKASNWNMSVDDFGNGVEVVVLERLPASYVADTVEKHLKETLTPDNGQEIIRHRTQQQLDAEHDHRQHIEEIN